LVKVLIEGRTESWAVGEEELAEAMRGGSNGWERNLVEEQ